MSTADDEREYGNQRAYHDELRRLAREDAGSIRDGLDTRPPKPAADGEYEWCPRCLVWVREPEWENHGLLAGQQKMRRRDGRFEKYILVCPRKNPKPRFSS